MIGSTKLYILPTNPLVEVDRNDVATLVILLQYQGVGIKMGAEFPTGINAGGITAALKLPRGFEAWGEIDAIRNALYEYISYFEMNPNIVMEYDNPLPKIPLNHEKDEEMGP
jgi:hypothetical protein